MSKDLGVDTLSTLSTFSTLYTINGIDAPSVLNREIINDADIKYITTASCQTDHINLEAASMVGIKVAKVPFLDIDAKQKLKLTIKNLDLWTAGKYVGKACCCQRDCPKVEEMAT